MNIPNILAVADAIESHSIKGLGFNMDEWISNALPDRSGHKCGTTCCIAGTAVNLQYNKDSVADFYVFMDDVEGSAAEWLGLGYGHAEELFYARRRTIPRDKITSAQAVRCLRNLAATGVVDWARAIEETP